jgi:hypothetical protein
VEFRPLEGAGLCTIAGDEHDVAGPSLAQMSEVIEQSLEIRAVAGGENGDAGSQRVTSEESSEE